MTHKRQAAQRAAEVDPPTRRGALALLGAAALAPAALAVLRRGPAFGAPPGSPGAVVDGLRFEVLGSARRALAGHPGAAPHTPGGSWPDVVRVQLRVLNAAASALLLSPGQFRLRVAGDLTVMPTAWLHGPAALPAGEARTGWIDFRAPASAGMLALDFSAAGRGEPVTVPLTGLLEAAR